jgi:hypothetical protein
LADLFLEQLEVAINDPTEILPKSDFESVLNLVHSALPSSFSSTELLRHIYISMEKNRLKNILYYRFVLRHHQATINLLRYNLYVRKINFPFQDFPNSNQMDISEYQYIDYGIGSKYYYCQPIREKVTFLESNLVLLKFGQYLPFKARRFLKKIILRTQGKIT